ncbi:MAG: carboxypeptidase-like regulatory domain-containing protein [Bacteroidales bacterium]|nr:carboxypeptidase-like regulatory domain-containing protein [Bacteroidales bacterium]
MQIKKISLILLLVTLSVSLFSQKKIRVSGYITDEKNRGIELVNVTLWKSNAGTTSNPNGYFDISISHTDTITLVFSCLGYKKTSRTIPNPQKDFFLNVQMVPLSTTLKDVTVKGTRKQTNMMQSLDAGKVRLLPDASGGNIESLIVTFAGVSSNNEMSSQYSVRGGNFDENLVYINGVEVYRPLLIRAGQQEGLSIINPDMVSNVAFSSGGFDAKYGDKMSSVLDITYKKPTDFEGSISASMMGGTFYLGNKIGKFTQMHGIRYKRNTSLLGTLQTKGEYDPSFIDYQTFMTYTFNKKWDVSLLGNISQNKYNFIPQERTTSFGTLQAARKFKVYFDGKEEDLFETGFGSFALNFKPDDKTSLSLLTSAFLSQEKETYDIIGQYWLSDLKLNSASKAEEGQLVGVGTFHQHARNRLNARVLSVSHQGSRKMESNTLQWGFTLQNEHFKDRISEWEMRDSAGYSLPHTNNGVNVFYNLISNNEVNSNRISTFLQDTYRLNNSMGLFFLTAGIRASYWDFNKELIVSPRFTATFVPDSKKDLTLRLAGGVYYQAPFYKEFRDTSKVNGNNVITLNNNIKSQRSIQLVVGGDYNFRAQGRPFKLTAEAYYKKLDNLIPYNVDNVRVRYYGKNMASGYAAGLDCKLFGEYVPGTDSWISFSLMKSEETINGVTVPRPTDQAYSFSLYFQDYWPTNPKYKLNLKMIWADGLPVAAPQSGREYGYFRTPSYKRVDIGVSRMLVGGEDRWMKTTILKHFKTIWLGVDLFNMLDIKNTNSYFWVSDIANNQYAVPNYLTARQLNLRLIADF